MLYIEADAATNCDPTKTTTATSKHSNVAAVGSIARKRWNILAKALTSSASVPANVHCSNSSLPSSTSSSSSSYSSSSSASPLSPSSSTDSADADAHDATSALEASSNHSHAGDDVDDDMCASVRRFASFDLMEQDRLTGAGRDQLIGSCRDWSTYRMCVVAATDTTDDAAALDVREYTVNIHHIQRPISAVALMGFNNTGNVCVWPSEEALAYYALVHIDWFTDRMVLELGGGMTCLAGLLVAKYGRPFGVHLTDGNARSVANVRQTCRLNDVRDCYVKCSVLQWEWRAAQTRAMLRAGNDVGDQQQNGRTEQFDYILSADCLFFDEARAALVETMWTCLAVGGRALVMAPRRGATMADFVRLAEQRGFGCVVRRRYDERIWRRHVELMETQRGTYDEDLHYPILIELTK